MNKIITFEPIFNHKGIGYCEYCNSINFGKEYPSRRLKKPIFVCNDCMYKKWSIDK